jgi:hypothetical protein
MMNLAIGGKAELTDGRIATILMIHPDAPIHPLVQTGDRFYDLRQYVDINVLRLIE